jgi:hypothetical protein
MVTVLGWLQFYVSLPAAATRRALLNRTKELQEDTQAAAADFNRRGERRGCWNSSKKSHFDE